MKHLIIVIAFTLSTSLSMATCKNAPGSFNSNDGVLTKRMVSANLNTQQSHASNSVNSQK